MNVYSRGFRNAFRNVTRSVSIIIILGLAIGLCLVMLIARQAVSNKINSVNSSIGNTVSIAPAGFSSFSSVNNALTTSELSKLSKLSDVTGLSETLTDRLTTIGSTSTPFGSTSSSSASSDNQTSLTSPVSINVNKQAAGGGPSLFISGGHASGASLPANFSLPISIIGTDDPSNVNGSSLSMSSGSIIGGNSNTNDALVSTAMASKNNLSVGSTFTAYSQTLTVSGIFSGSSTSPLAGNIIVSLPTEQRLSGQSGAVTSAVATIDSLANVPKATTQIKNALGSSATVTSSVEQAQNTTAPLNNIKSITLYSLIGAVVAGIVIIFLIMIMIVRERRREIGVLKAIGGSNFKVVIQFISEAVTLTIAGAIIGIIIGVAAANPVTHTLVKNETTTTSSSSTSALPGGVTSRRFGGGGGGFAQIASGNGNFSLHDNGKGAFGGVRNSFSNIQAIVGWSVVLYGIGSAVVIAVIGSMAASFLIAKVRPAEVMRQE